jgi:16S rRNA (guanine527-N7)-methyltransferase
VTPAGRSPKVGAAVRLALVDAQRFGFLGPGPVEGQVQHAVGLGALLSAAGVGPARFLDLGSGGGIPGLVLAEIWPECEATLLDSASRRAAFLRRTVGALGWESRVAVGEGRAETLARLAGLRAGFPLVVARSFAAPAITAEIGGAFVGVGGALAVSEPTETKDTTDRWPTAKLEELGLAPAELRAGAGARCAILRRIVAVEERWPRGVGIPAKRPLW